MLRTAFFRNAFLATLVACAAGPFAAWAGDAALISAIEGKKICIASFESATWTPMLGETIPEKTGLEIGPESSMNLVHFGTNSEVTLPAGSRVTVLMAAIEGLASDASQAMLENMPQGLDFEARHQQQVGAVNPQHIAMAPAPAPGKGIAKSPMSPEPSGAGAGSEIAPAQPAPLPETPVTEPISANIPPTADSDAAQKEEMLTRGGGSFNKAADIGDLIAEQQEREQEKLAEIIRSRKSGVPLESNETAIQGHLVSLAVPASRLNGKIGELDTIIATRADTSNRTPSSARVEVPETPGLSTSTWILVDIKFPEKISKADIKFRGTNKRSRSLALAISDKTDVSVSSAVHHEFQGYPAQAAAIWIKLLKQGVVSPEIAAAHLRRLSIAIDAKLR